MLTRIVLLGFKNKRKCLHNLWKGFSHVHFSVVLYIDTGSKHYIAMNKDEIKVR